MCNNNIKKRLWESIVKKKSLLQNWKLNYENKSFLVSVPGDIVNDLMQNNVLPDYLIGDNYKQADWVHNRDWTYSTKFTLTSADLLQEELKIVFHSVDTYSEIKLNGQVIGNTDNMFRAFSFNIKGVAVEGENVLTVTIFSIREKGRQLHNDRYTACFNDDRVMMRKPQCHFGWDWAPNFPGTGIVGNVEVSIGEKGSISAVQILDDLSGAVSFIVEVENEDVKAEKIRLSVEKVSGEGLDNSYVIEKDCTGSKNILNAYIENVQLWYPNGYGKQPLYAYKVEFLRGENVVDAKQGRFAFRKFQITELPLGEDKRRFDMYCNGVRIRAIGSNWVPASIMIGCAENERYNRLLQYAQSGGLNMLRVWGGGLYEKEIFYNLCDELGIIVWQDFMFACCVVPDEEEWFREEVRKEAIEQVKRLRNHPSIVVWCGGNEVKNSFRKEKDSYGDYINHVILPAVCYEHDGTRKYVWDSPYSCTDIGNDKTSGDCHNNALSRATAVFDIENYRKYQWGQENNFDSECAVLGMCRLRSFKKFMPENQRWPQNDLWEDRLSCNPYDDSVVSFTERINLTVEALFGKAETLSDYIKKSMIAHAEVLNDEISYYRSFENNSGLLNWMYNDIWGNATWAIVDYYYEKKPAYYAMKRAGRRKAISVVYRKEGYFVSVVNDTNERLAGALKFAQNSLTDDNKYCQMEKQLTVEPFSQVLLPIEINQKIKNTYLYTEFDGLDNVYFFDSWKDKTFVTDISVEKKVEGNVAYVTITANEFARTVFIDLPDGVIAEISDNYFDLPKNASKTIMITAERDLSEDDISVKTFADEWTE